MAKKRRVKIKRRPICAEDIKEFKLISDPQISAAGSQIVFVVKQVGDKNNYLTQLWLVETAGGAPRQFTSGKKDRSPRWSPSGHQIAFVTEREEEQPQIYLIDVAGGEASQLTSFPEGSLGQFRWSPDGKQLAVVFREQHPDWTKAAEKNRKETGLSLPPRAAENAWYRLDGDGYFLEQRYKLYLVDAESGESRVIYDRDTIGSMDFDFSPDSRELIVSTNRDKRALPRFWRDELLRINLKTGKSKRIAGLPEGPKSRVRWSADGRFIAYAGREGADESYSVENLELFLYDLKAGKVRSLTEQEDYCLLAVAITDTSEAEFAPWFEFSSDGKQVLCRIGVEGEMRVASVSVGGGRLEFCASDQPDCAPGNVSSGDGRLALTVGGSTTLPEIAVARCRRHDLEVSQLSDLNGPLLQQLELATPKSHWIKAADGHRSQAWVMKPPGARAGKKYPAVLQIHGGPHAQYGLGFFHEFQVLAAAGYVVVFSNPRGSKGYGRDHCAAIQGNWGSTDWTDIQGVTRFMQKHPSIDPSRIGIMGGSYGGYMTNWAIGHSNDYLAAISDRCVSNLVSMSGNSDFPLEPDRYFPGNFWDRPDERWRQSPIAYFGEVQTPTLIIHSEGDLRCNIEQSEQVFAALTCRAIPARFVRYPATTSHGMSRKGPPDLRIHRLQEILNWWACYLKGKPA